MSDDITKTVEAIHKALGENRWAEADRLQLVLNELVKIEVAAIQGKSVSGQKI